MSSQGWTIASHSRTGANVTGIQGLRLRDRIVDRLREEIVCGKLSEGEPLRETPLAERFDVSRGPIRDAILQLASEGWWKTGPIAERGLVVSGTKVPDRPWSKCDRISKRWPCGS